MLLAQSGANYQISLSLRFFNYKVEVSPYTHRATVKIKENNPYEVPNKTRYLNIRPKPLVYPLLGGMYFVTPGQDDANLTLETSGKDPGQSSMNSQGVPRLVSGMLGAVLKFYPWSAPRGSELPSFEEQVA